MNAHAEFRRLLTELRASKREVVRVEGQIEQLVANEAARLGLPYDACLQHFLQAVLDDDSPHEPA